MLEGLAAGGPVMIPIGLCSVAALAVFLERFFALRKDSVVPHALAVEFVDLLGQARWSDAQTLCRKRDVALARVFEALLASRSGTRTEQKERVEEVGRREVAELERFIPVLGTIAAIAPLLGLLGTVGGMILTFQVIETQGIGQVGALAGGISQALITTFAGLSVGIPALVANRFLLARVDRLTLAMEEASLDALDALGVAQAGEAA